MNALPKITNEFDRIDAITELSNTIKKIKALVTVYGNRYVDAADIKERVTALYASPEIQTYLYAALIDAVCEADQRIDQLNS